MKDGDLDELMSELDRLASLASGAAMLAEHGEEARETRQKILLAIRAIVEHLSQSLNNLARRINEERS